VSSESAIAIIPARYESTRLPGKPLLEIAGKTLIEHVYRRVAQAKNVSSILIATDDSRIETAVQPFGGTAIMTRRDHQSGTDRIAEVVRSFPDDTLIVNVQGDEPLIEPEVIDRAVEVALLGEADIVTLKTRFENLEDGASIEDPNRVKVVARCDDSALFFSRSRIPSSGTSLLHLGLYVYTAGFIKMFTRLARTPLEMAERLEQLRALEHGFRVRVVEVDSVSWGIDTPADLEKFKTLSGKTHHG
jgi:3-deoxy-manno-octulosonate cytidylyltransferase (CMP-KDO synthetase)